MIAASKQPKLRQIVPLSLALAAAALAIAPLGSASAQCPGCDEYTLDIPSPGGGGSDPSQDPSGGGDDSAPVEPVAPAPAPAAPVYPVAPATEATDEALDEAAPTTVVPEEPGIRERRGPRLPVTMRTIAPHDPVVDSAQRPIVPTAAAEPPERSSMLPLIGILAAIAIVGAGLGLSRRQARHRGLPGRLAAR